jgi:hypothetical protein
MAETDNAAKRRVIPATRKTSSLCVRSVPRYSSLDRGPVISAGRDLHRISIIYDVAALLF